MEFTLGSDPEIFLTKVIRGEKVFFPAIEVVHGDKWNPVPIDEEGRNVLVDNVMLEFNTKPVHDAPGFIKEHENFLEYIKEDMAKHKCEISKVAYTEFQPRFLDSDEARTFGCIPDFNAYSGEENDSPDADGNFRCAAGHIHIGYDNHSQESNRMLVKLLDLTIGLDSVIDDVDTQRRRMYGKAGAHRPKDFGVEYRVLSNYWIFNDDYMNKIYKGVEKAFELMSRGFELPMELEDSVVQAINTYDKELAKKLIKNIELN